MARARLAIIVVLLSLPSLRAQSSLLDFESLANGSIVTNQFAGLVFSSATIARAGISLDELEFPPHSGVNVAFDSSGPVAITFSPPVAQFSGYFNYRVPVTIQAFDASNNALATSTSKFSSNLAVSGVTGSSPNEFLRVSGANIARVTITGDPNGTSFSLDDVSSGATLSYLVGDAFPYTADSVGNFGDGILNTLDLIAALRAIVNIPGYLPAACSDRFDAMDAFPVDTPTQRGGDGLLNTLDLIETLRRATNIDISRPTRVSRGLCSVSPQAVTAQKSVDYAGVVIVGPGQNGQRPVYLQADLDLPLAGFSLGLSVGQTTLPFAPASRLTPSLTDSPSPGVLAAAWLDGLNLTAGQPLLLGYIGAGAGAGPVTLYSASGNTADGHSISFRLQEAQPR